MITFSGIIAFGIILAVGWVIVKAVEWFEEIMKKD